MTSKPMILADRPSQKSLMAQAIAWACVWLPSLALCLFGLWWLRLLHGDAHLGWPVPGWSLTRSCLLAFTAPTAVTSQVWYWREKRRQRSQQGRLGDPSFGRSIWLRGFKLPFFALVTLIPLFTGQSRAHPVWPGLTLCLPCLYVGYLALLWCGARLPEPMSDDPRLVVTDSGKNRRTRPDKRRIPLLAIANEQEIVFRQPLGSRVFVFLMALAFVWVAAFGVSAALAGKPYGAGALLAGIFWGSFGVLILAGTGPNETRFDLATRTYRMRRYKPLPGRWAETHAVGVPFWEQETAGRLDDVLRLEVREVTWKRDHSYWLHVVWKDPHRPSALLSVLHSPAEAEALRRRVAEATGVPSFAP